MTATTDPTAGIVLLNFGEPAEPDRDAVVPYLERIFFANASVEGEDTTEADARERARELAERRAPGLIEEYEAIGGSPLTAQAEAQADALQAELDRRGYDARTYYGTQFANPSVADAVAAARDDDVDLLVGLPIYPLCGPSTTVDSLRDVEDAVADLDWDVSVEEVTGWHRHPLYNRLRVDNLREFVEREGVALDDPGTRLVFSAHGTPEYYLERGSRYDVYVREYCENVARMLDVEAYKLGYQNHSNRDIPWTEPEVEDVVGAVDADRIVVEPVSFMHEQSETLSELDVELREEAEAAGLDFHRVPVPHDDDRFPSVLADLAEPFVADFDPAYYQLRQCECKDTPGTVCLNAPFEG